MARSEHVNFLGSVTWAFEFEDQSPFEGFRELATNGIDKPVLNAFRMFGLLGSRAAESYKFGSFGHGGVLRAGVRKQPDVNVIASRREHEVEALIWNYHDDDVSAPAAEIDLNLDGLPLTS